MAATIAIRSQQECDELSMLRPVPGVIPQRALLVGFQDQDNLGLRYLMSAALGAGGHRDIVTYQSDPAPLLERIRAEQPTLIGFSLIFQYMAPDFARVITALREAGVR